MQIEEKQVTLRKLTANEGKVIISKKLDEENKPNIISKEIYLGIYDNEDNYEEVDENIYNENTHNEANN